MRRDSMRYALHIEMLERDDALDDREAIELLQREFALALNAGCFSAISPDDIGIRVRSRSIPQEGVTRYAVALTFAEHGAGLDDERALALLRQALTNALNASYFLRVCLDDRLTVTLVAREPADRSAPLSAA